jgi:tricorn protease
LRPTRRRTDISTLTTTNRADGFAPSPTGDYVAVDFRGEIMIVPTEAGVGEMHGRDAVAVARRLPDVFAGRRRLAYVSDESGEEEVWVFDLATAGGASSPRSRR